MVESLAIDNPRRAVLMLTQAFGRIDAPVERRLAMEHDPLDTEMHRTLRMLCSPGGFAIASLDKAVLHALEKAGLAFPTLGGSWLPTERGKKWMSSQSGMGQGMSQKQSETKTPVL